MTLKTNPDASGTGLQKHPGSNARSKDVTEAQGTEGVPVSDWDTTLPLPTGLAPTVPSPPAPSPSHVNLPPNQPFYTYLDL